ncbi:hypothetical protein [Cytophaga sp. FL35]|uniref:hypothetical protein n=1 Tax=Cytophaga sp. FL35 TaxID=1904456 RepID=UPI00165357D0|nr:hypothetical protein [Cytophaga sp. FL35]MBC6999296.1 hypothetical protein [Cytophaga sp. FL35]
MGLKFLFVSLFSFTAFFSANSIEEIREAYIDAAQSEKALKELYSDLTSVAKNDDPTKVAYKGAVTTMMARYADGYKAKKDYFKDGKELLEHAIEADSKNVEIRCLRLSIQENLPKILGYHRNVEEDKDYILEHYKELKSQGAKNFVKGYIKKSESFSEEEKQLF